MGRKRGRWLKGGGEGVKALKERACGVGGRERGCWLRGGGGGMIGEAQ